MGVQTLNRGSASVTTTDATVTTLLSISIGTNQVAVVRATVSARNGANALGVILGVVVNDVTGTPGIIGAIQNIMAMQASAALAACVVTLDISGTTIRVRVTGIAATTINWQVSTETVFL